MRSPHMRLSSEGHMYPVSLTLQLRTCPRAREGVIDLPLGGVDVIECRRWAERGLYVCVESSAVVRHERLKKKEN